MTSTQVEASSREIVITRVVNAPRELVWKAWTTPEHVANWWGPLGFSTTIHEMDVRPGGVWSQTMHGPDGANYPNKSVFVEVDEPNRIVYKHAGGREEGPGAHFVSTWTFEEQDGKTAVTIHQLFDTPEDRDLVVREFGAIEGGKQTLGRLDEYVSAMAPKADHLHKVVVKRVFMASAERVYDAWLDAANVGKWLLTTPNGELTRVEVDARIGGGFIIAEIREDGLAEHFGTYVELDRPRRLAFDFSVPKYTPDVTRVTVEIVPQGDECELTLTHEGVLKAYEKPAAAGWKRILETLGTNLGA